MSSNLNPIWHQHFAFISIPKTSFASYCFSMNDWNRVVQGTEPRYSDLIHQASVYGVATGYCISASLLSVINKWAIMKFPFPGALTALQYFTNVIGVLLCGQLNLIGHDPVSLLTLKVSSYSDHLLLVTLSFCSTLTWTLSSCFVMLFLYSSPLERPFSWTSLDPRPSLKTWIITGNTFTGTLGLLICMFGGVMYQQSTSKKTERCTRRYTARIRNYKRMRKLINCACYLT